MFEVDIQSRDIEIKEYEDSKNIEDDEQLNDIPEDMRDELRQENQQLNMNLNILYEDIYDIEKATVEISEMLIKFERHLVGQTEQINVLRDLAQNSNENVKKANKTLKKIDKNTSESFFRWFYAYLFIMGSIILLIYDFLS